MGVAREYRHVRLVYHHILDVIERQHGLPHHLLGRYACLDGAHLQLPDLCRLEPHLAQAPRPVQLQLQFDARQVLPQQELLEHQHQLDVLRYLLRQDPLEHQTQLNDLQLLLRYYLLKTQPHQRDSSGESLEDFAANGSSFQDIVHKLWEQFGHQLKGRAAKHDGIWSVETPAETQRFKMMQLKLNKHLVDTTKTEAAWNQWLASSRGKTVTLLIFEYGTAISKAKDLDTFEATQQTDRAGATAEVSLRDFAAELEAHWGSSFQATTVTRPLWAKPCHQESQPFHMEGGNFRAPTSSHSSTIASSIFTSGAKTVKPHTIR
ncbi:hypothetical protein PI124_g18749 [Phytophthora idaei]|nr:hypothetical protein PI124_g18749 [Phytophthora idaei]